MFIIISGQPAIFIAIESSITDMETFQCFRGHNPLTNEFYTNGFQKPLQLTEIIVELPFMWKLSSIYCKYANYLRKLRGSYYKNKVIIPL